MRLFTAIDLPAGIKTTLGETIERLRPFAKLKWSPVANLHVTTKFIGEWPEERLAEFKAALAKIPMPPPFEVAIRGMGWYPNPHNPRVLWAGIVAPPDLKQLAHDTEQALSQCGVPVEDREFSPHLTLARRRDTTPVGELKRAVAELPSQEFGSFRASAFFLYLSAGGKYTQLQEFPFA